MNRQLTTRFAEDATQPRIEVQAVCRQVELLLGDLPRVDRRGDVFGGHGTQGPPCRAGPRPAIGLTSWAVSRTTPRHAALDREFAGWVGLRGMKLG
jgi:hypothetical protein